MNTRRALLGLVVALSAAFTACGDDDEPALTDEASAQLSSHVQLVRGAAEARNREGADGALAALRSTVETLRGQDAITDERAESVLAAAERVAAELEAIPTTTTTTTTTTLPPPPPPPPPPPTDDDDDNEGRGNGEGRGRGGDDD